MLVFPFYSERALDFRQERLDQQNDSVGERYGSVGDDDDADDADDDGVVVVVVGVVVDDADADDSVAEQRDVK